MAKQLSSKLVLEEPRYSFLDQNLIEFILSIPASQLLRPVERRSLMRRSLNSYVPREILSRRTKQVGIRTPMLALERTWEELRSEFDSPLSSNHGYINRDHFLETLLAAKNGTTFHLIRLLKVIKIGRAHV